MKLNFYVAFLKGKIDLPLPKDAHSNGDFVKSGPYLTLAVVEGFRLQLCHLTLQITDTADKTN